MSVFVYKPWCELKVISLFPLHDVTPFHRLANNRKFLVVMSILFILNSAKVVSMPEPLVKPTTSPILTSYLVSLIIQNSAGSNISSAVNKKKLELKLASYYQEKQQLPVSTNVSATVSFEVIC